MNSESNARSSRARPRSTGLTPSSVMNVAIPICMTPSLKLSLVGSPAYTHGKPRNSLDVARYVPVDVVGKQVDDAADVASADTLVELVDGHAGLLRHGKSPRLWKVCRSVGYSARRRGRSVQLPGEGAEFFGEEPRPLECREVAAQGIRSLK